MSIVMKIPVNGIFGYITQYLLLLFFVIDSLGVIPKYSLYLWRKFLRLFNPIISGRTLTEYFRFPIAHVLFPCESGKSGIWVLLLSVLSIY